MIEAAFNELAQRFGLEAAQHAITRAHLNAAREENAALRAQLDEQAATPTTRKDRTSVRTPDRVDSTEQQ